ncbi:hypothetical protein H5410_004146 [Solanum commersonii]|uniref:Uncharacterized protein n=1 Tax=Solanum commersonii TaxID=4109 RepID=A0A9J6B6K6_SOLCO|nr:hypothetical protein H5410_004146 [Solanum commersonii]
MTEAFKRLNAKVEELLQENTKLMEQIKSLKGKDSIRRLISSITAPRKEFSISHTASPDQTVAGKDTSNPFMAVTLPKSEGEGSSSRRRKLFQQGQDKHVITPPNPDPNGDGLVPDIERNRPNTSPRNTNNNITRSNSSGEEDYREHSYYQDAQNPNADDDSGMSFDSEALHNLDT